MVFVETVKDFLMKVNFDFDDLEIDLYKFHPQLRIFLAVKGIFFNNEESLLRLIWPGCCIALTFVGLAFETIFIYHGIEVGDNSFATECFCYWTILGVVPVVYTSVLFNKDNILELLDDVNNEFVSICKLGPRYRVPFLQGQLLIWQLCYAWFLFVCTVGGLFILFPVVALLYQTLFVTHDEHLIRPLPFPMWLPKDDPYRTPNYEIFFFLETNYYFIFIQTFCVYVYTQFHVLLHYYYVMNMIILDLEVIFDGLDESVVTLPRHDPRREHVQLILNTRMKRIVKWHISVFKAVSTVSSVYGPPLVYQVMFSSIIISLIAYQVADKLDHGKFDILFVMLGVAGCIQLWIPCYLGTMMRNKAFEVADACWNCGWQHTPLGRMLRLDIVILIHRAQQPVTIKFTGLPNVQLETFSSIMSTAYSYFNMLRQYK